MIERRNIMKNRTSVIIIAVLVLINLIVVYTGYKSMNPRLTLITTIFELAMLISFALYIIIRRKKGD